MKITHQLNIPLHLDSPSEMLQCDIALHHHDDAGMHEAAIRSSPLAISRTRDGFCRQFGIFSGLEVATRTQACDKGG
ncbi:MAG: hypothetical protein ACMUJI_06015 [Erythrobacter sp.]|uniref:hypothetical protein n=1 Tax=Erythrobacter sp. TaxID=1042 RepID=UPI003A86B766